MIDLDMGKFIWKPQHLWLTSYICDTLEICEVPKYLNKLNPLLKVIKSCAETVVNAEFMHAVLHGCPIPVVFVSHIEKSLIKLLKLL